jgi:hypothetical protein
MASIRPYYSAFALGAMFLLTSCGDLTRSEVERILNGEGRGSACVTGLDFNDGGFERAKASGAFSVLQGGLLGATLKVADTPDGDQWQVGCLMGMCANISRKTNANRCLPGKVEVLTIADAPFAPNNASYKIVEFVEVVTVPSELARIAPYVYTRYKKSTMFQKTDRGWRVAQ